MNPSSQKFSNPIPKLYEDDHFVVFDKPPRLLVIPSPAGESRTLVSIVNEQYVKDGGAKLHPCHRLDRDTSGVILFAKGKQFQKKMMDLFAERQVKKTYVAFVQGRLSKRSGEFRGAIRDFDEQRFRKNVAAKTAVTQYHVVEERTGFSVVEVQLLTGRTNQIRIHFSQAGHPLVGEQKYAFRRDYDLKFRRVALHAAFIAWKHCVTGQMVRVTSELPKDMEDFLTAVAS